MSQPFPTTRCLPPELPRLLCENELAAFLRVDRATLWRWRRSRNGPPAIRLGGKRRGRLVYDLDALRAWLAGRTVVVPPDLPPRLRSRRRPRRLAPGAGQR